MTEYEPEIWVDLKDDKLHGTENKYSISSYGRVWNKESNKLVEIQTTGKSEKNNDYFYVNLKIVGQKRRLRRVHYLMAYSFFGEPPKEDDGVTNYTCDHINIDRFDNNLSNLRWLSKKGQMKNRKERTNTLIYKIKQEYQCGFNTPTYSYFVNKIAEGYNYYQTKYLYEQTVHCDCQGGTIINWKGCAVYFNYLCSIFSKDVYKSRVLYNNSWSLEDIFINLRIDDKDFSNSYEIDGIWYPSKVSISDILSLGGDATNLLISLGNMESLTKELQHREECSYFTGVLRQERLHGKDWGNGLFGTIRGIARKYKVKDGTLWHRVNKCGMTMKEALDAPNGNISHYWYINNKWYNKLDLCESLGITKPMVTQRVQKGWELKYALVSISGAAQQRLYNLNGNLYSKSMLASYLNVPINKIFKLGKKYKTIKDKLLQMNLITDFDYFEEIFFL